MRHVHYSKFSKAAAEVALHVTINNKHAAQHVVVGWGGIKRSWVTQHEKNKMVHSAHIQLHGKEQNNKSEHSTKTKLASLVGFGPQG